ncbi:MAG: cupin domain-containing protein [Chitinophagales bacterium]|nr:cupin domain-containing protein [Chitinophagales bacterium]HAE12984.1 hypothetical protein [Bacteroidota bacterium]MCB9019908.1 cupin domain-containing protein [Chitinophagales bacterium]HAE34857.1 hypothetical protein [Bacteroidota bacterium]HPE98201.1 cupin domain-containing protein [Chitinophagales bacterium]
MKHLILIPCILFSMLANAQLRQPMEEITEPADLETIKVQKLYEDSLNTTYVIWVRTEVPKHYHAEHTETIYVLEGIGLMTLGDQVFNIVSGDLLVVPFGTPHSVKTMSKDPLKVISVQSPFFDGSDRIPVK